MALSTAAQQYLASLKSDGSGMADQPNANWSAMTTDSPGYATNLYSFGAPGGIIDWSKLGYTGDTPAPSITGYVDGQAPTPILNSPDAFNQWAASQGLGVNQGKNAQGFNLLQLTQNGTPIAGASHSAATPNNDGFNIMRAVVNTGLLAGAGAAAYGAYGGAGTSAAEAGATGSSGLSSADLAALHSAEGYGATTSAEAGFAGMGAQTAGGAAGITAQDVAANPSLWNSLTPTQQSMITKGGMGAVSAAAQGGNPITGAATGAAGGYLDSNGQWISGINNSSLLNAGVGLLGAAAGAAGAGSGLNSATTTDTKTIDPRIAQYIYGANGTSGLLSNVNNLMNSQLSTGGLNATQTQGLNAQLSALQDPAYTSSLNQMRSVGSGLLGGNVAGNPFTSGQPSAQSAAPAGQQAMPPGWQPMATQLNQPQNQQTRPQMTGLLNNVRPYAS